MGCCEAKNDTLLNWEPELYVIKEESYNDLNLEGDECRSTTNPNMMTWGYISPINSSRPRSTSYSYSKRIELAFLAHSPGLTRLSEATRSVLVPYNESSLDLKPIKEEKDTS